MTQATTDSVYERSYRPNFIHAFYGWLDLLAIPDWFFIIALLLLVGLVQHLVAWSRGVISVGQFNTALGTVGISLDGLIIGLYVLKGAPRALDEFRPLLDVTEEKYAKLRYEFVMIPSGLGTLFFLIGMVSGAASGFSDMAASPEVEYAAPIIRIGVWMVGSGLYLLFGYQILRQLRRIGAFYAMPENIDLFNPRPLYGFSRYTATLGIILFFLLLLTIISDPTELQGESGLLSVLVLIPMILLIFYLLLSGAHRRLVSEKDHLLQEVNSRISIILERAHLAAFEEESYSDVSGLRTVFSMLKEEKVAILEMSTWPWRQGTFTGLISALLLPIVLLLIREILSRLLG